ncbi:mRNA triphosphatase CET1 [Aaosphaeria arxii CBS 175.79]|uniref:mRNA-capping enzyme subunit beta n=1 Tax=Aaosphaeria arxii CBS 175.79 TaxID=1450172 RepID=A0A6A5Y9P9_9PLEO|nr:mRNA triphosphatase CET1 [Aaosphaeria arxii CBS 175.79]KAF2021986.1 mRNA triphosphatase CET1 [Aaosphaeria arxii CBS 175.79]
MNISDLLSNPGPEATPRRSPSNPHSITAASPAISVAKLPTPPHNTHKAMPRRRQRHDPRPIWAVREHEALEAHHRDHRNQRRPSRAPSATPRLQAQPLPSAQHNGNAPQQRPRVPVLDRRQLTSFERPLTNDNVVYDETSRQVCDLIWDNVVMSEPIRQVLREDPHTHLEIEARWGQILDKQSNVRLHGIHRTECVVQVEGTKFESTMSLEQHKKMNQFLNKEVTKALSPEVQRPEITYRHTHEVDTFYELDQAGFALLHPVIKAIIQRSGHTQRVRVTTDQKTGQITRKIIKLKLVNLEISSPRTEWDYRIGINLEVNFPGPVESLQPAKEGMRGVEERRKDRMSYSWLGAYTVDLTQVTQSTSRNHELELELDPDLVLQAADSIQRGEDNNNYEPLIVGLMNNLRVLSREMTKV